MTEYRIGFADGILFALMLIGTAIALTILFYPSPKLFAVVSPKSLEKEETKEEPEASE